jgi:hypothetical protein
MNSCQIRNALHKKHEGQVFFHEVKNGPSWNSSLRIMDAMAILPSWSPITIVGYEIKVSRSDFLNDTKWTEYLKCCHQFVWVCPKGLIKKEEVDPVAGLMYCNDNGKLLTQKRPVYRNIELPAKMLLYLLLWRGDSRSPQARADILREMAEDKELGERYRRYVSKKLKTANDKLVGATRHQDNDFDIKKLIEEIGVDKYELVDLLKTAKAIDNLDSAKKNLVYNYINLKAVVDSLAVFVCAK